MTTTRRALLALAASAPALAAPHFASAAPDPLAGHVVINALGGIEDPNPGLRRRLDSAAAADLSAPDVNDRAIRDLRASGVTAVNVTLGYVAGPQEPFEDTVKGIGEWDAIVRARPGDLTRVLTAADILRAKQERKVGVIYGFQNAAQIGEKPARVDIFADLGVRVVQLTYNPANMLGDGSIAPLNRGLTPAGREVVERLNARRLMVDLSHSGQNTCLEAARVSKAPISINHTGCRALTDLPRNKTDEELKLVADKGGFVGVYFMPFLAIDRSVGPLDVALHLEHAVNVCGEDHVGIGTDGGVSGYDDLQAFRDYIKKDVEGRKKLGISAPGERGDLDPFVIDFTGPEQFRKLVRLLESRGWRAGRIEKILGRNYLRFATEVWRS
jgi:membrane dipeptidase